MEKDTKGYDNSGKCVDCGEGGFRVELDNKEPRYCVECGAKRFIKGYAEAKAKAK
jgi:DNA-directed RNA polymerase subunit RPC12/RpoP